VLPGEVLDSLSVHQVSVPITLALFFMRVRAHDREVMGEWKERLLACGVPDVRAEFVDGIPVIEILERAEAAPSSDRSYSIEISTFIPSLRLQLDYYQVSLGLERTRAAVFLVSSGETHLMKGIT